MNNNLLFLPIEIQNIIFSYTRPVYPFIKQLKEKVEKYINFHKGFSKALLEWARIEISDKFRVTTGPATRAFHLIFLSHG